MAIPPVSYDDISALIGTLAERAPQAALRRFAVATISALAGAHAGHHMDLPDGAAMPGPEDRCFTEGIDFDESATASLEALLSGIEAGRRGPDGQASRGAGAPAAEGGQSPQDLAEGAGINAALDAIETGVIDEGNLDAAPLDLLSALELWALYLLTGDRGRIADLAMLRVDRLDYWLGGEPGYSLDTMAVRPPVIREIETLQRFLGV